jgi:hypothetical protein
MPVLRTVGPWPAQGGHERESITFYFPFFWVKKRKKK